MTTKLKILGVDPGLHGGWALLDDNANLIDARHFPHRHNLKSSDVTLEIDLHALAAQIEAIGPTHAIIEAVSSRPRQAGAFKFGFNTGAVHGVMASFGVETQTVAPQVWKSVYGIKRRDDTKRRTKNEARIIAANNFPEHAKLFERVKDDGVAEAALIALWGWGQITNKIRTGI